jgi:hypothetical protein
MYTSIKEVISASKKNILVLKVMLLYQENVDSASLLGE